MTLATLGDLDAIAHALASDLHRGPCALVVGPTGSGRLTLAEKLRGLLGPRGVHVSPPPFQGHDGPAHALLQIAAALGVEAMEIACDAKRSIRDRASRLSSLAAAEGRVIVLRVPESWRLLGDVSASRARRESNARDLMAGITGGKAFAILIAHEHSVEVIGDLERRIELPAPSIDAGALNDAVRWGAYGAAFERVRRSPGATKLSPIQYRLLVGAAALGQDPEDLIATLSMGIRDLRPVIDCVIERLLLDEHRVVADAFVRVASARFPVPKALALAVAGAPEEHVPFFTECVAYEHDGCLRVPDQVRAEITGALRRRRPEWETHDTLAKHHRSLDGSPKPPPDAAKITHWLERVHHLGRTGRHGEDDWTSLELAGPEQILDRAWSLSAEYRQFEEAARLYNRLLNADRGDAYAWHYLGFNLDRAGAARHDVEHAYREAVRLDPQNPWWNSRLVTFLIKDLRYDAADTEWVKSLERVDPKGDRVRHSPLLARHFHRWVVDEWLRSGEIDRAKRVYQMIPRRWLGEHVVLQRLRQRFEDALEAVALGESVYPADVPIERRWKAPRVLEKSWRESPLMSWMPGRILAADGERVTFVGALVATERRVFKKTVTVGEWVSWTGCPAEKDQFFEMGFYGEDRALVHVRLVNTLEEVVDEDEEGYEVVAAASAPTQVQPSS